MPPGGAHGLECDITATLLHASTTYHCAINDRHVHLAECEDRKYHAGFTTMILQRNCGKAGSVLVWMGSAIP